MQTQTKDPSGVPTMKIDTSILNNGKCRCLGHICLLNLEARLTPISTPRLVVNPVMHKISVGCWLLDPYSTQRDYVKHLHVCIYQS